jgi:acetylornithine deacetylase/succinyl-diaminopimelate desuccinylase-like protein
MRHLLLLVFVFSISNYFAQAFTKKTIVVNANAGIPHLYKGIVKVSTETELFKKHFESIAPSAVTVKVTPHHGGQGYVTPIDSIGYQAANKAYTETFGVQAIPVRSGGSIPIVALFEKELKSKTILMGFGLDSDAIHSPNEHFGIFNYLKGIETIPLFYKYFVELSK